MVLRARDEDLLLQIRERAKWAIMDAVVTILASSVQAARTLVANLLQEFGGAPGRACARYHG
jgi:hypothetical protein